TGVQTCALPIYLHRHRRGRCAGRAACCGRTFERCGAAPRAGARTLASTGTRKGESGMNTSAETRPPNEADRDFSGVDRARVIAELKKLLPPGALLYDTEDVRPYECDGLSAYRQLPLAVALPSTE